jgi:hypothetical protein
MQSKDLHQNKAAIRDQAFLGNTSVLHHGTGGRREASKRPASGDDSRLGALVSRRKCQNRICRPTASLVKELAR